MTPPVPATPEATSPHTQRTVGKGYLFGLPLGNLGCIATIAISLLVGCASFFASTFLGIVGLLIDNMATHQTPDYTISYRLIGLPVGLLMLAITFLYLGYLWVRRITRSA